MPDMSGLDEGMREEERRLTFDGPASYAG